MSRCCAADPPAAHHSGTSSHEDFVSILHCLFGANAIFHFDTALRSGAEDTGISGRGDPSKLIDEKKVRGWDFLHLLKIPCPRRWSVNPKISNLPFLKILCFNHFPIFSFWKKSPKVFFPQSHLVSVSRFDIYNYKDFLTFCNT